MIQSMLTAADRSESEYVLSAVLAPLINTITLKKEKHELCWFNLLSLDVWFWLEP